MKIIEFKISSCTGWIGSSNEDQRKEYDKHDECHGFVIIQKCRNTFLT